MTVTVRPALVAALVALAALGAVSAQGQGSRRERDREYRRADPAAVIAAELAFARAAQDKGQWTAFAEYAAKDAVMFVPETVDARDWLKDRANPPQSVRWQPHQVWSSCDGTLAVTKGAWQRPDGSVGYFTTVWQRQGKRGKTEYRWVMDQGDTLAEPLQAPEMIEAKVAGCRFPTPRPAPGIPIVGPDQQFSGGQSDDGTLQWHVINGPGAREVHAIYWDGSDWQVALRERVAGG